MARFGFRVQLMLMLVLVAGAEFLIGDLGLLVHQLDLPSGLADLGSRQPELAALFANMLLVIGAIILATCLPALVRRRPGRSLLIDETLVLLALGLLGALAVHALGRSGMALAIANLDLALLALVGALRVLRGKEPLVLRVPASLIVVTLLLPQVWRATLEFGGGEEGSLALFFRRAADFAVPAAWALGALFMLGGDRRSTLISLVLGGAASASALLAPVELRHVLATVTGLWFSTYTGLWLALILGPGLAGLAAALFVRGRLFLGLGILLLAFSGFRASGAGELLIQAIAVIMIGHWAEGRGRRLGDLDPALL